MNEVRIGIPVGTLVSDAILVRREMSTFFDIKVRLVVEDDESMCLMAALPEHVEENALAGWVHNLIRGMRLEQSRRAQGLRWNLIDGYIRAKKQESNEVSRQVLHGSLTIWESMTDDERRVAEHRMIPVR